MWWAGEAFGLDVTSISKTASLVKLRLLHLTCARGILINDYLLIETTTFKTTGTSCTMCLVSALVLLTSTALALMWCKIPHILSVLPFCTTLHTNVFVKKTVLLFPYFMSKGILRINKRWWHWLSGLSMFIYSQSNTFAKGQFCLRAVHPIWVISVNVSYHLSVRCHFRKPPACH